MVNYDQVELVVSSALEEGDIVLAEGKVLVVSGEGFDRSYFDLLTASTATLPNLPRVLKLLEPVFSFDPASAVSVEEEAPTSSLLITKFGPAVYLEPYSAVRPGLFVFVNGQTGDYRRSHEPAFLSWRLSVGHGSEKSTILKVDLRS